ncbi:hypothetical protein B0H13DRAFT_2494776 [Mycena leptocephala]|nr:hypothetical protein B0H13DRAFT_2494776 [Mycena leptocephala]
MSYNPESTVARPLLALTTPYGPRRRQRLLPVVPSSSSSALRTSTSDPAPAYRFRTALHRTILTSFSSQFQLLFVLFSSGDTTETHFLAFLSSQPRTLSAARALHTQDLPPAPTGIRRALCVRAGKWMSGGWLASDSDTHGIATLAIRDGRAHKPEHQATSFDGDWEGTVNKFASTLPPVTVLINGRDEPRVVFDVGPLFEALILTDPAPFALSPRERALSLPNLKGQACVGRRGAWTGGDFPVARGAGRRLAISLPLLCPSPSSIPYYTAHDVWNFLKLVAARTAPTSRRRASAFAFNGTRYSVTRPEGIPSLKSPARCSLLLVSAPPSRFRFRPRHRLHRCRTACSSLRGPRPPTSLPAYGSWGCVDVEAHCGRRWRGRRWNPIRSSFLSACEAICVPGESAFILLAARLPIVDCVDGRQCGWGGAGATVDPDSLSARTSLRIMEGSASTLGPRCPRTNHVLGMWRSAQREARRSSLRVRPWVPIRCPRTSHRFASWRSLRSRCPRIDRGRGCVDIRRPRTFGGTVEVGGYEDRRCGGMMTRRMCTTAGRSIVVHLAMGGNVGGAEVGTERRQFIWSGAADVDPMRALLVLTSLSSIAFWKHHIRCS